MAMPAVRSQASLPRRRITIVLAILVALVFAGSAQAAPAFVQGTSKATSGTSTTVSYSSAVTAGNLLVGMFRAAGTTSVSDSQNGVWTKAVGASDGVNSIWYRTNALAGTTTVTVSGSTSGPIRAVIAAYSGIATSAALDGTACNTGTGTTATTGTTASVPAGELAFAGVGTFDSPITVTAGAGATLRNQFTGSNGTSADEDVLSTVAGTQNKSFTLNPGSAGGWASCIATFKPPTAPPPTCTQTLSPGANVGTALTGAAAGSKICLNAGTYTSPSIGSSHGTAAQHVTLTSTDPSSPATLNGRMAILGTASYLDFTHLKFTFSGTIDDTITVAAPNNTFAYNDVSGGSTTICLNPSSWNGAVPNNTVIDHNLIHDCGDPANTDDRIHAQGIYVYDGSNDVVTNNWCWNVAARCYQVRGGTGGSWRNNVSDNANYGWMFGDNTPTNNIASNNIVGPDIAPTYRYGNTPGTYDYGGAVAVYMINGGTGNSFTQNCISSQNSQIYDSSPGLSVTNNTVANVQFVNAAAHNYTVAAGSPCQGFGAQGTPGP
jgi:hypothetical protein